MGRIQGGRDTRTSLPLSGPVYQMVGIVQHHLLLNHTLIIRVSLFSRGHHPEYNQELFFSIFISCSIIFTLNTRGLDFRVYNYAIINSSRI